MFALAALAALGFLGTSLPSAKDGRMLDELHALLARLDAPPVGHEPAVSDAILPLGFSPDGKFAYVERYGAECERCRKGEPSGVRDPRHPPGDTDAPACSPRGVHGFVVWDTRSNAALALQSKPHGNPPVFSLDDISRELTAHGIRLNAQLAPQNFPMRLSTTSESKASRRARLFPTATCTCAMRRTGSSGAPGEGRPFDCADAPQWIEAASCNARATIFLVRSDGRQRLVGEVEAFHSDPMATNLLGTMRYYETPDPRRILVVVPVFHRTDGRTVDWRFFGVSLDDEQAFVEPVGALPWRATSRPTKGEAGSPWVVSAQRFVNTGRLCLLYDDYVVGVDDTRSERPAFQVFRRPQVSESSAMACSILPTIDGRRAEASSGRALREPSDSTASPQPTLAQPRYDANGRSAIFFKGIWKDRLLLDRGTGVRRHLVVWDLKLGAEVMKVFYDQTVSFENGRLEVPTEISAARARRMAPRTRCPTIPTDARDDEVPSRFRERHAYYARRVIDLQSLRSQVGLPVECVLGYDE
ncbi:MAG: hypothetical protein IPK13_12285 [Deltaproteobacteria bacterium]|nr:hypothetical protein [Deltaproteobacteria bacterium]